jgi:hypothetical protein
MVLKIWEILKNNTYHRHLEGGKYISLMTGGVAQSIRCATPYFSKKFNAFIAFVRV